MNVQKGINVLSQMRSVLLLYLKQFWPKKSFLFPFLLLRVVLMECFYSYLRFVKSCPGHQTPNVR